MILGDHFTPMMPFLPDGSGVFRGDSIAVNKEHMSAKCLNAWQWY